MRSDGTSGRAPGRRLTHDRRIVLLAFLAGLPGSILALTLLWTGAFELKTQLTLSILVVVLWCGFALATRERVLRPLQSVANLLEALREGDFSLRGRGRGPEDPIEEVMREVNALADTLREQRLGALEAVALMRKVMEEIDVGVFAFDAEARLRLVNRAGERLLGRPAEQLLARPAVDLGLDACLAPGGPRILDLAFGGGAGRFEAHAGTFRQGGEPHRLLVLTDLSRALRDEERQAWQRLIRVVGHELNNSLAPIRSIAGSLSTLLAREPPPSDWKDDMRRGLQVIGSRAEALGRFMDGYARLARLPPPSLAPVALGALVRRVAGLETRLAVAVRPGGDVVLFLDADQIEQLLINLIRNAVDAAQPSGGGVRVGWRRAAGAPPMVEIRVEDDGPGMPESANLFVPFFTTKPHGSGIGLVLCRQIAEAHGGQLTLENRTDAKGCVARIRLPLRGTQVDRTLSAT
ncbi:MAG TPA: ATP-binding protein [Patescibacteria group bacterium]|nr:ATP-binding protein [Patescibacteria group bacterium]